MATHAALCARARRLATVADLFGRLAAGAGGFA
jgi:hypothetical protein